MWALAVNRVHAAALLYRRGMDLAGVVKMRVRFAMGLLCASAVCQAAAPLSASDYALLNRVSYGVSAAQVAEYQKLGRIAYLDALLRYQGDAALDAASRRRVDALPIQHLQLSALVSEARVEARRIKAMRDGAAKQEAHKAQQMRSNDFVLQASQRRLVRALYSGNPLQEQLTWFWFNHFNVFQGKGQVRLLLADYEERAIRPHVLGKFQDLLMAVLTHPAMLVYLDNAQNAVNAANENYARELMELHTLGIDGGYTQRDVQELARILTGVSVAPMTQLARGQRPSPPGFRTDGTFAFYPKRHDEGEKIFLGRVFPAGAGYGEVEEAVAMLAKNPATAHTLSRGLATYFLADDPPPSVVARMQQAYLRSDGDIAETLRALFSSEEFLSGRYGGKKFKDPVQFIFSGLRLLYGDDKVSNDRPVIGWLAYLGEPLYGKQTPDGYGLTQKDWASPDQMAKRFEVARALVTSQLRLFSLSDADPASMPEQDNARMQQARRVAQAAHPIDVDGIMQLLRPSLSTQTLDTVQQAATDDERAALLLASPEFMYR